LDFVSIKQLLSAKVVARLLGSSMRNSTIWIFPLPSRLLFGWLMVCGLAVAADTPQQDSAMPDHEFQLVRLAYNNHPQFSGRRSSWLVDAPEAEQHFLGGVQRLTRIDAGDDSLGLPALDERLFDYPFIYAVEVGHWYLSDAEAARLREYLLRGGFLMVDDFHGTLEWSIFVESLQRVFPDRPIIDLVDSDAIFHVLYDVDRRVQIPNLRGAFYGQSWEKDGFTPHWRGISDDEGRLMVAINFNMDLGDAWEHADNPRYPQPLTLLAYHFGINYALYAMTH
jgi:hypothetical protein